MIWAYQAFLSDLMSNFLWIRFNKKDDLYEYLPKWKGYSEYQGESVSHLFSTLCHPMDCSPSGSSVHEILQARILKCVAISFSRGSSQPSDWTKVSLTAGRFFTIWDTREVHEYQGKGSLWSRTPYSGDRFSAEVTSVNLLS